MQALPEEIDALLEVQRIDLDIMQLSKTLEELPQRAIILDARKNREALEAKQVKIEALKKDAKKKVARIDDEDLSLQKKENGVQAAIEAAGNDFRNAEARTKELNGIFKRRGELKDSRAEATSELLRITELEAQIATALDEVQQREEAATASFKEEGTRLTRDINAAKARHGQLLSGISADVASEYERTSERFTTVSICRLEGNQCSVCRAKIDAGRLIDLKQEAPLGRCPSCKRLMIITA